ncbi:MAG: aminotransferase class I/II-fold pyridoxal phosphate-dependent enzyme, partial [Lachnospiraceae bacterium]|nr:aminotransferase class I/II-fold pyridoxal phosphate-dependent enzyme [Lachnospiraceae bacterium]
METKNQDLYEKLTEYTNSSAYPFHMPGHKRNEKYQMAEPVGMDITEITGFDNLHHPEEIIKKEQEFAARIHGAKESFFLVNGSTCGILAAVSAAVPKGGRLLVCRNAHKSVYNAAYLRQLELSYLRQERTKIGLETAVCPQEVERALAARETDAVLITSPTYEGMVADVEKIAHLVHEKGLPLIVDEAHGAHFGFHPFFPESALQKGADLVIQSVHKTLPSLTQTAILHVGKEAGRYIDLAKVRQFLSIYQTSSPSYVLMGSIS